MDLVALRAQPWRPQPLTNATCALQALPIPTAFPPLPDVQLPAYTTHVLPNGLRVFLLEDHELGTLARTR